MRDAVMLHDVMNVYNEWKGNSKKGCRENRFIKGKKGG